MIDWYTTLAQMVWLVGLALILMTISLARWTSHQHEQSFRQILKEARFMRSIWMGLFLVSLGLLLLAKVWWQYLIWSVYALIFLKYWWQNHVE